jgi:hypothetical protein
MTRFLQKIDQLPKLSLRGQFGGVCIIEKYNELIAATRKRELYLTTFHPFSRGVRLFAGCIEDALRSWYFIT